MTDYKVNQALSAHRLSQRATAIEPFHVMEIMRHAEKVEAAGVKVIHLELGEPSFSTPEPIVEAGKRALEQGLTHYTRAVGIEPLRKAVANYYQEHMDVDLDWQRVVITAGASSGLLMALAAVLDTQDEILLTDPGYPCYPNYVALLGSQYRYITLDESEAFILGREKLISAWSTDTRALLLASPANPTGARISLSQLKDLSDVVRERDGAFLVDEIYQGLNYGERNKPESVLQVADDAVVTNSFSKFFGMTGWRIGWSVLPASMVPAFEKIAQNLTISPTTISQFAAIQAFSEETLLIAEERRKAFEQRRDYLVNALRQLGFGIQHAPQGAFYLYANIENFSDDSHAFCLDLLEKAAVAITPGLDFSASQQKRFVRFSYTPDMPQLEEAVHRIKQYLSVK
jgi:aspartate/methionine/tyrosine aminotransferase